MTGKVTESTIRRLKEALKEYSKEIGYNCIIECSLSIQTGDVKIREINKKTVA